MDDRQGSLIDDSLVEHIKRREKKNLPGISDEFVPFKTHKYSAKPH